MKKSLLTLMMILSFGTAFADEKDDPEVIDYIQSVEANNKKTTFNNGEFMVDSIKADGMTLSVSFSVQGNISLAQEKYLTVAMQDGYCSDPITSDYYQRGMSNLTTVKAANRTFSFKTDKSTCPTPVPLTQETLAATISKLGKGLPVIINKGVRIASIQVKDGMRIVYNVEFDELISLMKIDPEGFKKTICNDGMVSRLNKKGVGVAYDFYLSGEETPRRTASVDANSCSIPQKQNEG